MHIANAKLKIYTTRMPKPEWVSKIKGIIDLERIYADRKDILVRLRNVEDIYVKLDREEITREEALSRLDTEVFDDQELNSILENDDPRCEFLSPVAAVRHNIYKKHFFTPKNPQSDQSEAA